MTFTVAYTSPEPPESTKPQPASPIELDPNFVFYQIQDGGISNATKGKIALKDTKGQIREFQIVGVRPFLDDHGNQVSYEMFVLLVPTP